MSCGCGLVALSCIEYGVQQLICWSECCDTCFGLSEHLKKSMAGSAVCIPLYFVSEHLIGSSRECVGYVPFFSVTMEDYHIWPKVADFVVKSSYRS